ncbi:hypothetical protein [Pseudomonas phage UF_RH7]|nr:hypothetical protein [Pseudomonas phage UF_RH7]
MNGILLSAMVLLFLIWADLFVLDSARKKWQRGIIHRDQFRRFEIAILAKGLVIYPTFVFLFIQLVLAR